MDTLGSGSAAAESDVFGGRRVSIQELGRDEIWLQNWLASDPSRLGLGPVKILAQELTQSGGGSLDMLVSDGEVYYSVEVQLGEVDASHGFRVFDYWARNQGRYSEQTHVAVIVAESAKGRFEQALTLLAEYVPLLVIELRAWKGEKEAIVTPEIVIANDSVDLGEASAGKGDIRTAKEWEEECTAEAWEFHEAFVKWAEENLGANELRVDYGPKSYIGVRRGRRVWAPLWPTRDGATVHLPDPDGSRSEPSVAFESFQELLHEAGLSPSWTPTYNAGANPILLRLRVDDLSSPVVQDLLRASWGILTPGAKPHSESPPPDPEKRGGTGPSSLDDSASD